VSLNGRVSKFFLSRLPPPCAKRFKFCPFSPLPRPYARQGTGFQLPVRLRRFAEQNVPPLWSRSIDDASISECLCTLLQFWSITVLSVIMVFKLNSRSCHVQTRALAERQQTFDAVPVPVHHGLIKQPGHRPCCLWGRAGGESMHMPTAGG
jgi:hypothetical protein